MKQLENLAIVSALSRKKQGTLILPFVSIFLGITLLVGVIIGLLSLSPGPARADEPDQAQIIVQFDNDEVIVQQISFTAPISGYEALRLTGLELVTDTVSFGLAICKIEGVGDPAGSCFSTGFWSYYYWDGSSWATYSVGASESVITDKAIELWSWQPEFTSLELPAAPLGIEDRQEVIATGQAGSPLQPAASLPGYGGTVAILTLFLAAPVLLLAAGWLAWWLRRRP